MAVNTYKIVIIGAVRVGKSALINQLVRENFLSDYEPTIQDSYQKTIIAEGKEFDFDIIDTSGQDKFEHIRDISIRTAQGFIIVFSVDDPSSFHLIRKFYQEIKMVIGMDNFPFIICANKCDLQDRKITKEEGESLSNDLAASYIETSARTNINVEELFIELASKIQSEPNSPKKIFVIGSESVGKSAIIHQLISHRFITEYDPTIEDSYYYNIGIDGKTVPLKIYDTAGQDDFKPMHTSYMRQGNGFIFVYSIDNRESFLNLESECQDLHRTKGTQHVPLVICGNKLDKEERRVVSSQEGHDFAEKYGGIFVETSAFSNTNIENPFLLLTREILKVSSFSQPFPATEQNTTQQSTTQQSTTPQRTTPQSTTPQSTTPQRTTPQSTTPQSTTPQRTTPQRTTQQHAAQPPDPVLREVRLSDIGIQGSFSSTIQCKTVLVGPPSCGKTCIMIQLVNNSFPGEYIPTVFDNYSTTISLGESNFNIQFWDTGGQPDYERIRPLSYPQTEVFVFCFSLISPASLIRIVNYFKPEVDRFYPNAPSILVGCKSDLRDSFQATDETRLNGEEPIPTSVGEKIKTLIGAQAYIECSALNRININQIEIEVIRLMLQPREAEDEAEGVREEAEEEREEEEIEEEEGGEEEEEV